MTTNSMTAFRKEYAFEKRHLGLNQESEQALLDYIGFPNREAFIKAVIPNHLLKDFDLPIEPLTEQEVMNRLRDLASLNQVNKSFLGLGYYGTYTPSALVRNFLHNPAWYTAYTPYQAEISQGRLELLLHFQTMVCDLTGMQVANASMLDEGTSAVEAVVMAKRVSQHASNRFLVSEHIFPQTLALLRTRTEPLGYELVLANSPEAKQGSFFAFVSQTPDLQGNRHRYTAIMNQITQEGGLNIVIADILSLTLFDAPGKWENQSVDIVVGSTQRFGVPMGFGGPHAAYFATRLEYLRQMPGRIVGTSVDSMGNPAHRLTLQTREQHIRRDKATSNICTAQVLLANLATLYAMWHGPKGLQSIGLYVHQLAHEFKSLIQAKTHFKVITGDSFFDSLLIYTGQLTQRIIEDGWENNINLFKYDDNHIYLAFDETVTPQDYINLAHLFGIHIHAMEFTTTFNPVLRTDPVLQQPNFNRHHSETHMMRFLRSLADKDIALNRSMISLGSCTMKLNASVEMDAIQLEGFNQLHPFAPQSQTKGYAILLEELGDWLCKISGYDAISFQPNSGAQGEYAGLLTIRAYFKAHQQSHRNVCLIPSSAHGTNPASAALAGFKIVVVKSNVNGDIDFEDLQLKVAEHKNNLAALMITYPSTHGVFESHVQEVCDLIHKNGGQVYLDGANMNALTGYVQPGKIGADVSHFNLHKTFSIPHGGGGPGMGPIGVKSHLSPYLPNHVFADKDCEFSVSAAPYGSPSILPIVYAYIHMMGKEGLKKATYHAILNANYVQRRLSDYYTILYRDKNKLVAHECIVDFTNFTNETAVTVEDVAKRMIDYGFHAPTMSFPVANSLMIEPTESESKEELDRFCEMMIDIYNDAQLIKLGKLDKLNNPLKKAPHTQQLIMSDDWSNTYSRKKAAYPLDFVKENKYWPSVGRIDNVFGDRNPVCSCPSIDDYR